MKRPALAAALLSGAIYLAINIPMMLALGTANLTFASAAVGCINGLIGIAISLELAENILALCWNPNRVMRSKEAVDPSLTAVVMTVCDDWRVSASQVLGAFVFAGHEVYVLDDSEPDLRVTDVPAGVRLVRRGTRSGAKAGNLNHWLKQFGDSHKYVLLLDSDSGMTPDALNSLVQAAHHEDNSQVAVFQSKIRSTTHSESPFARLSCLASGPRSRVLERVHMRLNLLLAAGHNELLRLSALKDVGGFDGCLSNEDTALTLSLTARRWGIVLLDVWSSELEPETVTTYVRRTARWARQTAELFRYSWPSVPLRIKLQLCRHLLTYWLPVLCLISTLLSVIYCASSPASAYYFQRAALTLRADHAVYGLALWATTAALFAMFIFRWVLGRTESIEIHQQIASLVVGSAAFVPVAASVAIGMVASLLGRNVRFIPTNSQRACHRDSTQSRKQLLGVAWLNTVLICCALWNAPGAVFFGLNVIWLPSLLLSPVLLHVIVWVESRSDNARCGGRGHA